MTDPGDQGAATVTAEDEGFAAEERVLCADEGCIGLVGQDGRCKVCGKPGPGGAVVKAGADGSLDEAPAGLAGEEAADLAVVDESARAAPEEADDFSERRLCPDEGCIGLLDADGRCKVCGRSGAAI